MELFGSEIATFSVAQLVQKARLLLETQVGLVRVQGEIGELKLSAAGHAYFTLKDEQASLDAVMFRGSLRRLPEIPSQGDSVECLGTLTVYERQGRMQLVVDWIEPLGAGELARRFAALKKKLEAEGLFDQSGKRPIPAIPRTIGIVTSLQAAALQDVLSILGRRMPSVPVLISPAQVQGEEAAPSIVRAIDRLVAHGNCDVILLTRGGGSEQDLWPFNEEQVVRAVAGSPVPIVSAVGHETDIVLTDLAADMRAPTPSAAAELLVPDTAQLKRQLAALSQRLIRSVTGYLAASRAPIDRALARMGDPRLFLAQYRMRLDDRWHVAVRAARARLDDTKLRLLGLRTSIDPVREHSRIVQARQLLAGRVDGTCRLVENRIEHARQDLAHRIRRLEGADPRTIMERGFAIVYTPGGKPATSHDQLASGDRIELRLARGGADALVERTWPESTTGGAASRNVPKGGRSE